MQASNTNSFNAGYRLGQFVRPLVTSMREVLTSPTERSVPRQVDYTALAATPTMVRNGVDLSLWQDRNLKPINEPVPAGNDTQVYLLGWDGNVEVSSHDRDPSPVPSFPCSQGRRSSLDALI